MLCGIRFPGQRLSFRRRPGEQRRHRPARTYRSPDGVEFYRKYAWIDPGAEREVLYLLSSADGPVTVFPPGMRRGAYTGGGRQIPAVGDDVLWTERGPLSGKGTYEARIACSLQKRRGNRFYLCFRFLHPLELCFRQTGRDREDSPDQYISCMGNGCRAGFKYIQFAGDERKISITFRGFAKGRLVVTDGEKKIA